MLRPLPAGEPMAGLLTAADGPPFHIVNPGGKADCLLICDHASRRIPERLGDLGLDAPHLEEHIAWDIGAEAMTRWLAERLDVAAVIGGFSRLVVDLNRYLDDPGAFVEVSDLIAIPGNRQLSDQAKVLRIEALYRPYHAAITDRLGEALDKGRVPTLISIHTMTERLRDGHSRPQEVTLCWARDGRLAVPLMAALRARGDVQVGDNVPYGLDLGEDFSVPEHAMRRGLPHLQIEVRQDLVGDDAGAHRWAGILLDAMAGLLASPAATAIEHHWT
jgi:predicted N-formylglutamate amidohydrolase